MAKEKIIKKIIRYFALFMSKFPLKYIVFESMPDLSDNTMCVYNEMVKRNLNLKYKFVWLCYKKKEYPSLPNTIYAYSRISQVYFTIRAKLLLSCNAYMNKWGNYQTSIYLGHGIALKSLNNFKAPFNTDYAIGLSEETNKIMSKELGLPIDRFVITGYPRNDALLYKSNEKRVKELFDDKYSKIIVWYPTFRQHNHACLGERVMNSLPIIHDLEVARRINNVANRHNILIVIKPHFSQDISYIKDLNLRNILFINDDFFFQNKISSYEFVGGCDALITDYSSIYFDYLLCNKPIVAIWEDINEYKNSRGFCVDVDFYMKGAYKVYTESDFVCFLDLISKNKQICNTERMEMLHLINKNTDSCSTERVVDFIETILQ